MSSCAGCLLSACFVCSFDFFPDLLKLLHFDSGLFFMKL
ncbi:hypothetical protein LEP1GSC062_2438 [Leptospira alexanderi serovar Manhao 3 str. L 60]|uniref:Uncharacterized protein n=1 Tax=Leptospira alexanderi serovar Manhao 3 str. L 60 TaxID=1049759 RepID=V6I1D8_9LEPT|nr:hypothetical protein LEP1GSC062_2438 [Leptospira alexanderi serovar Manhao 3 str. L 60]